MQRTLTGSGLLALIWLVARLALGWHWLDAGLNKLGESAWTGANAGAAVAGFLGGAIDKAQAPVANPEVSDWFATLSSDVLIPNADIFSYLVVAGEIAVGVALLAGFFTKVSAGAGIVMNFAFLLAGTSSSNPYMILIGIALIVAARPGYIGVDYFVMPAIQRAAVRVMSGAQWRRWAVASGGTVGVVFVGFLTYVMLDELGTFVAIWAAAIPFGVLWLLLVPRLTARRPATKKAWLHPLGFRVSAR